MKGQAATLAWEWLTSPEGLLDTCSGLVMV